MRSHQPGSTPIDIPETVPNPAYTPRPLPTPERGPTKVPEKVPEKQSFGQPRPTSSGGSIQRPSCRLCNRLTILAAWSTESAKDSLRYPKLLASAASSKLFL